MLDGRHRQAIKANSKVYIRIGFGRFMSTDYCLTNGSLWGPRKLMTEERKMKGEEDTPRVRTNDALEYRVYFDLGRYFVSLLCWGE